MDDEFYFLDGGSVSLADEPDAESTAGRTVTPEKPKSAAKPSPREGSGGDLLFFDLETVPDESRMHLFDLPELPPIPKETDAKDLPPVDELIAGTAKDIELALDRVIAPQKYLDELYQAEKQKKSRSGVFDHIEKARGAIARVKAEHEARIKLLSTTPEYCSICAMGWAVGGEEIKSIVAGDAGTTEDEILECFWDFALRHSPIVAFNGLFFDIPVILVRSAILNVVPSKRIDLSPYGRDVIDPYLRRFGPRGNTDKNRPGGLKDQAKMYGIEVPDEGMEGSQVYGLWKAKEYEKIGKYVRSDVHVLREYHRWLAGYFWD